MTDTATPATGPVDAPASNDMASVLSEFAQDTSTPKDDAVQDAVRELTEQPSEGDAEEAPQADAGEVETPETEVAEPDDDSPDDLSPSDIDPTARYTVKVNGQDHKVSFAELKAGYSRNEDYKTKTTALADDRRAVETERAGFEAKYADQLKQTTDLFVQLDPILSQANQIDWQGLAQDDPQTYTQLKAAYDARLQAIGQARAEIERVTATQAQEQQTRTQEGLAATEQAIRASDPGFADDSKFTAHVNQGVKALQDIGLDGDDIMALMSNDKVGPSVLSLVGDAIKFRAQAKAREALPEKRVVKAPAKPLKSEADSGSQARKAPPMSASLDSRKAYAVQELIDQMNGT